MKKHTPHMWLMKIILDEFFDLVKEESISKTPDNYYRNITFVYMKLFVTPIYKTYQKLSFQKNCYCNLWSPFTDYCLIGFVVHHCSPPKHNSEKLAKSQSMDRPTVPGLCSWIKTPITQPQT